MVLSDGTKMWIRFIVVGTVFIVLACWLYKKTPVRASARMAEAAMAEAAESEANNSRPEMPPEERKEMVASSLRHRKLKKGDSLRSIMKRLATRDPSLHGVAPKNESDTDYSVGLSNTGVGCESGDSEDAPSMTRRKLSSERNRSNSAGSEGSIFNSMRSISSTLMDRVGTGIAGNRQECTICLQGYQEGDSISCSKYEGCNHVFHTQCIEAWLAKHDECPLCRISIVNLPDEDLEAKESSTGGIGH